VGQPQKECCARRLVLPFRFRAATVQREDSLDYFGFRVNNAQRTSVHLYPHYSKELECSNEILFRFLAFVESSLHKFGIPNDLRHALST